MIPISSPHRRRPSDVAGDLLRSLFGRLRGKSNNGKRSLSTGDLAEENTSSTSSSASSSCSDEDYMEMDFGMTPTTVGSQTICVLLA